ncbi:MAG: CoA-binding protein [Bacteroidota bacterium]
MIYRSQIEEFFNGGRTAIVAVSRDPKKFSNAIFRFLIDNGLDVIPVNSTAEEIYGQECYASIPELPDDIKKLLIIVPPAGSLDIVRIAKEKGITAVWFQKNCNTEDALSFALENFENVIHGECIFMWAEPVKGVHKFHRTLRRIFSGLPK